MHTLEDFKTMEHVNGGVLILCIFTFSVTLTSSLNSDGLSLLALKAAITTDPMRVLNSWTDSDSDSTPCHWDGITCDRNQDKVISISLSNRGLTGYIPSELGALSTLTSLSLSFNNFSKTIPPHLFNAKSLTSLDLSHNSLTGPLPHQITSLKNLTHLDLSSNQLNGSLPEALSSLTHLSGTLNLSSNRFSGEIPKSFGLFPVILSLDLRENNLTGKVPQVGSLLNQGPTAFTGNPYLCGFPLEISCGTDPEAENPRVLKNPEKPELSTDGTVERQKTKYGTVTVSLISGISAVIGVVFVSVWVLRKRWKFEEEGKAAGEKVENEMASEEGQKGKFVVVDEGFSLELEDLLRASAYVVGKSRSGIVYKVVAGSGGRGSAVGASTVVAVRRLSDGDTTWKYKEFEAEVEAVGRVQHPNIVRLRAYYYASDEKLLISDFIAKGSLHNALHGKLQSPVRSCVICRS